MLKFSEYTLSISIKHLCKFINYLFSKKDLFNIKAQYEIWHDELPDTHRILLRSSGSVLCDCSMSWLVRVFQRSISTVSDFLSVARASRWDCRSRMSDCSGRIVSSSFPSCGETHTASDSQICQHLLRARKQCQHKSYHTQLLNVKVVNKIISKIQNKHSQLI